MKIYLPVIIATMLASFADTTNAQTCLSYWINPKTGAEECLNNFRQPYALETSSGYSSSNFSTGNFKISPDPEDPDGVAKIEGVVKNISKQDWEISTVNVDLNRGNTTLKNVKIEFSGNLAPGKSALVVGHVLKEDLGGVPLKQIEVVPTAVDYR